MSPFRSALVSLGLYGIANSAIDEYLKKRVSPLVMIVFISAPILVLALLSWCATKERAAIPTDLKTISIAIGIGLVLFFADYFYLYAYDKGGSAFLITSIFILLPVISAIVSFAIHKQWPTLQQVIGFGCIAAGLLILQRK